MSVAKPASLVEGVDYYIERGKFVFTSAYHLKRGYCCNSKCRHCPYNGDGGLTQRIEVVGLPSSLSPTRPDPPCPPARPVKRPVG